ncbi:MAG: RHS repeat-associated core domain-containing protein, partial [Bryobacterales bacterium]|nr:RHS repeat-associated core domain-containing protein [Bryobacterales bacterium]
THYLHVDHLGSTRLVTDGSGTVARRMDYTPFGVELTAADTPYRTSGLGYAVDGLTRLKFTGKERDAETGLDFFESRYFSSAQGRFTSPDAMLAKKEWLADPQRWNRYAYVRNNPLRFVDPNGEDLVVYYWDSKNLTDEQRKWLNENRQQVLDTIRDRFTKAGIKNVEFRAGSSLTAEQIKQLPGRVGIGQLNFQNTTNVVGEQFGVGAKGQTLGNSGVGMGPSQIFLGNLSDASFLGLRIPGFGLSGSDLATGAGEVGAHELGHRLGFDVVPESMYRLRPDNLLTEGMGNPNPSRPLYFRPTRDDRRVIDEINRIGDNTPKRRE